MRKTILTVCALLGMSALHAQTKAEADSAYAAEKYEQAIPI